jgi:hypothetical protein
VDEIIATNRGTRRSWVSTIPISVTYIETSLIEQKERVVVLVLEVVEGFSGFAARDQD